MLLHGVSLEKYWRSIFGQIYLFLEYSSSGSALKLADHHFRRANDGKERKKESAGWWVIGDGEEGKGGETGTGGGRR